MIPNNGALAKAIGALVSLIGASTLRQIVNHFGRLIAITINEFIFSFVRPDDNLHYECPQCKTKYYYSAYKGHFRRMKVCSVCAAPTDISSVILDREKRELDHVVVSNRDS